jgi:hypothetical protein
MAPHREKCSLEKKAGANHEKVGSPMERDPLARYEQRAHDRREITKR